MGFADLPAIDGVVRQRPEALAIRVEVLRVYIGGLGDQGLD
jgi:hypothetical protein